MCIERCIWLLERKLSAVALYAAAMGKARSLWDWECERFHCVSAFCKLKSSYPNYIATSTLKLLIPPSFFSHNVRPARRQRVGPSRPKPGPNADRSGLDNVQPHHDQGTNQRPKADKAYFNVIWKGHFVLRLWTEKPQSSITFWFWMPQNYVILWQSNATKLHNFVVPKMDHLRIFFGSFSHKSQTYTPHIFLTQPNSSSSTLNVRVGHFTRPPYQLAQLVSNPTVCQLQQLWGRAAR